MSARSWYRINAEADRAVLTIYGPIGSSWYDDEAVSAKQLLAELDRIPAGVTAVTVRINSGGGDVFDGIAIANALREQHTTKGRSVEAIIDGVAASAASVVAMGAQHIRMPSNALMMIHHAWVLTIGNAADHRASLEVLDKVKGTIVATYRWHSTLTEDRLDALMTGENGRGTWMDASEAIEHGLATEQVGDDEAAESERVAAQIDPRILARLHAPERYRARVAALIGSVPAPQAAAPLDIVRACREAQCLELAEALIASGATLDQVTARIGDETSTRAAAAARAAEITALCATANTPMLAASYIGSNMPLQDIRLQLTTITALRDNVEIDGTLMPAADPSGSIAASWKSAHGKVRERTGAGTQ